MDSLFIIILVIVLIGFIILSSIKKDKEKKMTEEVNRMIEANDIDGLINLYMRQLKIWGGITFVSLFIFIYGIYDGKHFLHGLIPLLFFSYRVYISAKEVYELKKIKKEDEESNKSDDLFWELINMLDWSKQGDDDEVIEPAVARLAQEDNETIFAFEDKALELTGKLNTEENREAQRAALTRFDKWKFICTSCCVVVNGKEYYESCLANGIPEDMWDNEFEALQNIAPFAWARKNNKEITEYPRYGKNANDPDYTKTPDDFDDERDYLEWLLSVENRLFYKKPDRWQYTICDIHYTASEWAKENERTDLQAYFTFKLSKNLYNFGDYESAKKYFLQSIELYNKLVKEDEMSHLDKIGTCYIYIAEIYNSEKQYDYSITFANHAIDTYQSVLKKYSNGHFIAALGQCHSIISSNYEDMGKLNESIESDKKALSLYEEAATQEPCYRVDVASKYWDISSTYNSLGQKDEAKLFLSSAIRIYEEEKDNPDFNIEYLELCKEQLAKLESESI